MQHFAHEEGRVRLAGTDTKYDYFVKDHLGNTRMTLTEARDSTVYEATMETALASFEESVFLNVAATRNSEEAFEGTQSAKLGPESIGPAKMLVVSPGDTVSMEVYAKFSSSFSSTDSGDDVVIGAALASVFGAIGSGTTVTEQNTYNLLNSEAGTFLASARYPGSSNVPKAYLNYILFDQDFNVVLSQSGYKKVPGTSSGAFDKLEINDKIMEQGGYLYVYLSNEGRTTDGGNVYFDALRVNHKKGAIIQEDHYYPFGLSINALSSSAPLSKPNNFKYNGKEEQKDFNISWYDYGARMYDVQLGRWNHIDPLSESYYTLSPYNYGVNNPIVFIDPDGRNAYYINEDGETILAKVEEGDHRFISHDGRELDALGKDAMYVAGALSQADESLIEGLGDSENAQHLKKYIGIYNSQQIKNSFNNTVIDAIGSGFGLKSLAKRWFKKKGKKKAVKETAENAIPALRQLYIKEVTKIKDLVSKLEKAKLGKEMIARISHAQRRFLGKKYKDLTPADKLKEIYARNLKKYGDRLGPTIDYLRKQGKSWDDIIESASRTGGKDIKFK